MGWIEPEEYFRNIKIFTDTASNPQEFTVAKDEKRLYLWNKPSAATLSYLYYAAIHPKVEKSLAFTSGGTYEIKRGDTVTGHTSAKTMLVNFVRVTSGSWAGGDAAGFLLGTPSGAFSAEILDVGSNLNVATIAGDATSEDNFQHFLGEEFDEVIIEGCTWKCLELIGDQDTKSKLLTKEKKLEFEDALTSAAGLKTRKYLKTESRFF
ncbi:MAG: hypothetical protein LUQ65_10505 [Candidatus Helarchaeota archaeon]|nr:hypothetical protein [Candidatus Helarchaeota archaeon]